MPVVVLETGKLNNEQKKQLISEFTKTVTTVTRVPEELVTIYIKENEPDNIGFKGKQLSEK